LGLGVPRDLDKAVVYFEKAISSGNDPLGHNGMGYVYFVGTPTFAVDLKKALQRAYEYEKNGRLTEAAFVFWKLAESGHEVSQSNLAYMLDRGRTNIFGDTGRLMDRIYAQRFFELAADQGSVQAQVKLGDYSYYGFGLEARFTRIEQDANESMLQSDDGEDLAGWIAYVRTDFVPRTIDYRSSFGHYVKASTASMVPRWATSFVARAEHNIGAMYEWGLGVKQDFHLARHHFERVLEVDPTTSRVAVYLSLFILRIHETWLGIDISKLARGSMKEPRVVLLSICCVLICVLSMLPIRYRRVIR